MKISVIVGVLIASVSAAQAQTKPSTDWPQFRGPNRNGMSSEVVSAATWPAAGPTRVWLAKVGLGFSSVAVSNGRVYTVGLSPDKNVKTETVVCLDAQNGKEIWHYSYDAVRASADDHSHSAANPGPRATPEVDGNLVFTVSMDGHLNCLDISNGKLVWDKKLVEEFNMGPKQWNYGVCPSPFVLGNQLIVSLGAGAASFDKLTGNLIWKFHDKDDEGCGYSSPVLFDNGGKQAIAIFTKSMIALSADKGEELWRVNKFQAYDHGLNGADPIFMDNMVFLSQGNYTTACGVWKFGAGKPAVVWENEKEKASMLVHFPTPILSAGYLYGSHNGKLRCIEYKTGNVQWTSDDVAGTTYVNVIAADKNLLVLTDNGELVEVAIDPKECKILGRGKVIDGQVWSSTALADGKFYCRNNKGELVCCEVGKK